MNVREYLEELQQTSLSPEQKRDIYSKFLAKSNQVLFMRKMIYYSKITAFSVGTAAVFLVFFSTYVPETTSPYMVTDVNDAIITYTTDGTTQIAQASTVGEIVSIQGKIAVYNGEEIVSADFLQTDSKVVLQKDASIEFTLLNGVLAAVDGPAEFRIVDEGENSEGHVYVLELIAGNSVRIVSLTEEQKEIENKTTTKTSKTKKMLVVKTQQVEVAHGDITAPIDVALEEKNGVQTIVNEGSDIVVKQFVNGNELVAIVEKNQMATLDSDDVLLAQDISQLVDEVKENQLTIRYELDEEIQLGDTETDSTREDADVDDEVKKIMSDAMLSDFESALARTTLSKYLTDMMNFHLLGNQQGYDIALSNLTNKLQRGVAVFTPTIVLQEDSKTLSVQLAAFADRVDSERYITPELLATISDVRSALQFIDEYEFGVSSSSETPLFDLISEGVTVPLLLSK